MARQLSRRTALRSGMTLTLGAVAYGLVGCGDDDDDDSAGPTVAATLTPTAAPATSTASPEAATGTPSAAAWRELTVTGLLPPPRRDHTLVADAAGRRVYLFGGRGDAGPLADLWVFDIGDGVWTELPAADPPSARFGHNAGFDPGSGTLVVFGGQAGPDFFSDVWAYDPAADAWSQIAAERIGPSPRYGAASAYDAAAGTLWVSHGFTDEGRFDDTWGMLTGAAEWTDISPAEGERPLRRCLVRGALDPDRNRLLIFGGQSNESPFHDDLWAIDLASHSWAQLDGSGPSARNLYAIAKADDEPYALVIGGATSAGDANDVWLLDLSADAWTELVAEGDSPAPRHGHDAVWLPGSGTVLLFGGQANGGHLADTWELTPA